MDDARRPGPAGRLITIEGVEGAGKSTQVARLAAWLDGLGVRVGTTSEPDGSPIGGWVRRLLADEPPLDPLTECFAFAMARAEHVARVIRPALEAGTVVICDRYSDSTVAYQGYGRGVPLESITALNRIATDGLGPDLTIVLDLAVEEGLRRVRARPGAGAPVAGTGPDPFEQLGVDFHERVRKGYRALGEREPERVVLVDAEPSAEVVAVAVRGVVAARLGLGRTR